MSQKLIEYFFIFKFKFSYFLHTKNMTLGQKGQAVLKIHEIHKFNDHWSFISILQIIELVKALSSPFKKETVALVKLPSIRNDKISD